MDCYTTVNLIKLQITLKINTIWLLLSFLFMYWQCMFLYAVNFN